jgi:hypothetical protein
MERQPPQYLTVKSRGREDKLALLAKARSLELYGKIMPSRKTLRTYSISGPFKWVFTVKLTS